MVYTNTVKMNMFEGKTYFTAKKYRSKCNGDYFVSKLPTLNTKKKEIDIKINNYTDTFAFCFGTAPMACTCSLLSLNSTEGYLLALIGFPYTFYASFFMFYLDNTVTNLEKEKEVIKNEIKMLE